MPKLVYNLVETIALQADMVSGYVSKQVIVGLLGRASEELFNHFVGRSDEHKPGPHVGVNTRTTLALGPFMRNQAYRAQPIGTQLPLVAGQFTLPDDYGYLDSYNLPGADTVDQVDGYELRLRLACPVTGPVAQYPIVTTVENGDKRVYPTDATAVDVLYYTLPPKPVYAETLDGNNNLVYNDAASADVGWSRDHGPELLQRTLRLIAQATKDGQLVATAGAITQDNA